jgi:hypothetical protein
MSVAEQVEAMGRFKKNMMEFFDDLIEQYPEEGDLIVIRFFLAEQTPVETMIRRFIETVLPNRHHIKNRDETFFLQNENVFGASPKDKVIHFKQLYLRMDKAERSVLWDWFQSFVLLADNYLSLCA